MFWLITFGYILHGACLAPKEAKFELQLFFPLQTIRNSLVTAIDKSYFDAIDQKCANNCVLKLIYYAKMKDFCNAFFVR